MRIAEIEAMNPWRRHGKDFEPYDHDLRRLSGAAQFDRKFPVMDKGTIIILLGPRQVGKTTLIKKYVLTLIGQSVDPQKILYLSLDRMRGRNELREVLKGQVYRPQFVFLDEASRLKGAMQEVKTYADAGHLQNASMLITGSSPAEILYSSELAPGRGAEGNRRFLRPLLFRDIVLSPYFSHGKNLTDLGLDQDGAASVKRFAASLKDMAVDMDVDGPGDIFKKAVEIAPFVEQADFLLGIYLQTGGFPVAINQFLRERQAGQAGGGEDPRIEEIFISDLIGDLAAFGKSESMLRRLVSRVLRSYGSRFSFQKLARDEEGGMGVQTVQSYLEFMEKSLIFHVLHAVDLETGSMAPRKEKKVHIADPFVHHAFRCYIEGRPRKDVVDRTLQDEEASAALIEGVVSGHLRSHLEIPFAREGGTFLFFHYDREGREIDNVLVTRQGRKIGLEVRYGRSVQRKPPRRIRGLDGVLSITKDELDKREDGRLSIPAGLFLSLVQGSKAHL